MHDLLTEAIGNALCETQQGHIDVLLYVLGNALESVNDPIEDLSLRAARAHRHSAPRRARKGAVGECLSSPAPRRSALLCVQKCAPGECHDPLTALLRDLHGTTTCSPVRTEMRFEKVHDCTDLLHTARASTIKLESNRQPINFNTHRRRLTWFSELQRQLAEQNSSEQHTQLLAHMNCVLETVVGEQRTTSISEAPKTFEFVMNTSHSPHGLHVWNFQTLSKPKTQTTK